MSRVKTYEVKQHAYCQVYGCNNEVSIAVGDPRFDADSAFLCEEHAREYYKALRERFNANMVGDDEPQKQTELFQQVLIDILEENGKVLNRKALQNIADHLNIAYDDEVTKPVILDRCLKFLKGGR